MTDKVYVYPDTKYYININNYIGMKARKEIWDLYFNQRNVRSKSLVSDFREPWSYKKCESFLLQKVNGMYFLVSNEVKW